jgi:hypothetical protein
VTEFMDVRRCCGSCSWVAAGWNSQVEPVSDSSQHIPGCLGHGLEDYGTHEADSPRNQGEERS